MVAGAPLTHLCLLCSQVETEDRFEWIGGSSIGGGTFWGLGALLTKTKVFQQLQKDASGSAQGPVSQTFSGEVGGREARGWRLVGWLGKRLLPGLVLAVFVGRCRTAV